MSNVCMMYGEDVAFLIRPTCDCCRREVDRVRHSMWHGEAAICTECFIQWYDPDDATVDQTSPLSIGNHVRKKHGLAPLTVTDGDPRGDSEVKPHV